MTLYAYLVDQTLANATIGTFAGAGDVVFVGPRATLASTGSPSIAPALLGTGSQQRFDVAGQVFGNTAIFLQGFNATANVLTGGILSGQVYGITFGQGSAFLTNRGDITGTYGANADFDITLVNYGSISGTSGGIYANGGGSITNYGDISGLTAVTCNGAALLANYGTISSTTLLSDVADSLTNAGTINGNVNLQGGNDLVDTSAGRISGTVFLGIGNDSYLGGAFADLVQDGMGNDEVAGGGGNDRFFVSDADGNDDFDGGIGIDTYDASGLSLGLKVNLATGFARTSANTDSLTGIERVIGGAGVNILTGDAAANLLRGGASDDTLTGGAGNDRLQGLDGRNLLDGGDGDDRLEGGAGRDTLLGGNGNDLLTGSYETDLMTGGAGADRFFFNEFEEFLGAFLDRITDFTQGSDVIDLSALDANQMTLGDDSFSFVGTGTVSNFGELGYRTTATATIISMAYFSAGPQDVLRLDGVFALTAADFLL